ncbi:uncharacterized protein PRCAT00005936001 [Priceomyces carsonii]|uniref:uncharacterized protein n=1 Tax=Priceomyces carsonii TaxID=28549 RepID=UPI002ED9892E|nr:unnamed protein product [Priceomyces carsonii]
MLVFAKGIKSINHIVESMSHQFYDRYQMPSIGFKFTIKISVSSSCLILLMALLAKYSLFSDFQYNYSHQCVKSLEYSYSTKLEVFQSCSIFSRPNAFMNKILTHTFSPSCFYLSPSFF